MTHHLDDEELPHRERELTLGTGAILGIFLGLAVLCGGFFGFGYNMGRKSAPTPLTLNDVNPAPASTPEDEGSREKPAAAIPAETPAAPTRTTHHPAVVTHDDDADATPPAPPKRTPAKVPASEPAAPSVAPVVRQAPSSTPASSSDGAVGTGSFMVQVAAVSHQEDANLLVSALRARGYAVTARSGSNDSFIHVQVGPFRDKKQADAMRQRLITDGYNAIVK